MSRLGHDRYGAQGSGGGAAIALEVARLTPDRPIGVHGNGRIPLPSGDPAERTVLTGPEQQRLARLEHFRQEMMDFKRRPVHPPAELPEDAVGRDALLTNVSLYRFTGTAGSSADFHYETDHAPAAWQPKERGSVPGRLRRTRPRRQLPPPGTAHRPRYRRTKVLHRPDQHL
ncbi:hypothetical protein [Spongiactinospora sp. 9N601]|uniref:hypothetical protein n=1 Tax=Spongiactinospora sp. 9N601 TaxID=3375149 RepID=UPI0037B62957